MRRAAPVISTTRGVSGARAAAVSREAVIYNAGMNPKAHQPDSLPAPGPSALAQSEALVAQIRAELEAAGGWLPFDRYMERALYAPGLGYYSGGARKFGLRGDDGSDFVTAPELSPLFAATLARPLAEALEASGTRDLMEFGAGTGKLAAGLLNALDALGVEFDSYSIVDLSGELRERQRETIEAAAPALAAKVRWLDALPEQFEGVVIGNEVLDAMPVRLFAFTDGAWHERGVMWRDEAFAFDDRPVSAAADIALLAEIETAGDDYVTETHDAARAFTRTICTMLARGAAFFIDYGFPRHEYYHAQRAQGTLMCHYRHRAHGDPFRLSGFAGHHRARGIYRHRRSRCRGWRGFARLHFASAVLVERGDYRDVIGDRSFGHGEVLACGECGAEVVVRGGDGRAVQGDRVFARAG